MVFLVLWSGSLVLLRARIGLLPPLDILVPVEAGVGYAVCTSIGYCALGQRARRYWNQITEAGPEWPLSIEYAGPLREVIRSFLTGQLPGFLQQPQGTTWSNL